jgi:RNA polymerase sigma-70 factor (ECF subfamily)
MQGQDPEARWRELMALLEPIHDRARGTARSLSRSRAEGDDLFQEALLRAFDNLSGLREPSRFRSWFYAVLLSVHRNRCRRAFWRRFLSLERETALGFEPAVEATVPGRDERRRAERVSRALASLPAVQREAVVLFTLEEFSIEEIAATQKVSISAVKSRLQRGRDRLRRFYEREGLGRAAPAIARSVQPRSFGEGSAP